MSSSDPADTKGVVDRPNRRVVRVFAAGGAVATYIALVPLLHPFLGDAYFILAAMPLAGVAALWGWKAGVACGLFLTVAVNPLLLGMIGGSPAGFLTSSHLVPALVAMVGTGGVIGYLRDMRLNLRRELQARQAVETELRKAKGQIETIVATTPSAVFTVDLERRITSWNRRAEALTGVAAVDAIGRLCTEVWRCSVCEGGCGLLSNKIPKPITGMEIDIALLNGTQITVIKNADLLRDDRGRTIGGVESFEDITAVKEAGRLLRESEQRFRELFNNMGSGVAVYDAVDDGRDFVIADLNAAGERITSVVRGAVVGRRVTECFPSAAEIGVLDALRAAWKTGEQQSVPTVLYDDGRISQWVENRIFRIATGQVVAIFDDRTEERNAVAGLADNYRLLHALINTIPNPIYYKDACGRYVGCNRAFADEVFGRHKEELIGRTVADIAAPEIAAKQERMDAILRENGAVQSYELRIPYADGTIRDVLFTKGAYGVGEAGGIVGVITDLTEAKRVERTLREYQGRLEAKNAEILQFTDMVTHDLKKPLATMKTVCSLIAAESVCTLDTDGKEAVAMGRDAIQYMQDLLDDLLTCARMEAGAQTLNPESIRVGEIVNQVVDRFRYQTREKGIIVLLSGMEHEVRADRKSLTKILMNLVGNAVSYIGTPPRPQIAVACVPSGDGWQFSVRDNGMGIPGKCQATIFEKFRRGDNVRGIAGTGLGLAIVKVGVEAHGGRIWFESREGQGTAFHFWLPGGKAAEAVTCTAAGSSAAVPSS